MKSFLGTTTLGLKSLVCLCLCLCVCLCLCEQGWWDHVWVCDRLGDSVGLCGEAARGRDEEWNDTGSWYRSQPQSGSSLLQVTQSTHSNTLILFISSQKTLKKRKRFYFIIQKDVYICFNHPPLSHHQASGDIRSNGDRYIYHIQLSGITNNSLPSCVGANICQVKLNGAYRRKIGSSSTAKYYIKGDLSLTLGFVFSVF